MIVRLPRPWNPRSRRLTQSNQATHAEGHVGCHVLYIQAVLSRYSVCARRRFPKHKQRQPTRDLISNILSISRFWTEVKEVRMGKVLIYFNDRRAGACHSHTPWSSQSVTLGSPTQGRVLDVLQQSSLSADAVTGCHAQPSAAADVRAIGLAVVPRYEAA